MTLSQNRQFLTNFDWTDSILQPAEIARIEDLLVKFRKAPIWYRHERGLQGQIDTERSLPSL